MRVFVAGATGAIGSRLVPLLAANGHDVVAMTRSTEKADQARALGADPVVADALDRDSVMRAVTDAEPEVVVHQLTALSHVRNLRRLDDEFALTNRLRTEGTDNLLAAARVAGTRRLVAQSYAGWPYAPTGGPSKAENDPLDPAPPKHMRRSLDAIRYLERAVLEAGSVGGVVLRYGSFYGPETPLGPDGDIAEMVRRRRFPIVGNGAGVWSFVHVDDAAAATALAIVGGKRGIYNIVDDQPATVAEWLPELAGALGAEPPRHVPKWLGRLALGESGVSLMTRVRGASNEKAKRELGWEPGYASWRQGFHLGLGTNPSPAVQPGRVATSPSAGSS